MILTSAVSRCANFLLIFVACAAPAIAFTAPLFHTGIISTQAGDFAHHTRLAYEFIRALQNWQIPPLTTVELDGGVQIPIFQYYTGTTYVLPAFLSLFAPGVYAAMIASVIVGNFVGGFCTYLLVNRIYSRGHVPLIAALSFQTFPFLSVDIYSRGAYPEWVIGALSPVLLLSLCSLAEENNALRTIWKISAVTILLTFFIPVHPLHVVYTLPILCILAAAITIQRKLSLVRLMKHSCASFAAAALTSSWYLVPIARDYGSLRIAAHEVFLNASVTVSQFLAPFYVEAVPKILPYWAVNWGAHFSLATAFCFLILLTKRGRSPIDFAATVSAALCGLLSAAIVFGPDLPPLLRLPLVPLQWNYRLFIPLIMPSILCLAACLSMIQTLSAPLGNVMKLATVSYIAIIAVQFTITPGSRFAYTTSEKDVLSPQFVHEEAKYFGFRGAKYGDLNWVFGGRVVLNKKLALPRDAIPFEFRIVTTSTSCNLAMFVNSVQVPIQCSSQPGGAVYIGGLSPPRGPFEPSVDVEFTSPVSLRVAEVSFKPLGDTQFLRPAGPPIAKSFDLREQVYEITGESNLYQLPIMFFPSIRVRVNGEIASQESSDRYMVVTRLTRGRNLVSIERQIDFIYYTSWAFGLLTLLIFVLSSIARATVSLANRWSAHRPPSAI